MPARHRRLHRRCSATCAPPGWPTASAFVEATVDPGRDSVARLAAYQKEFGADWDLWTGTPAADRRLLEAVRRRATRSSPRSSRPRSTGGPASRSPTTSTTPTATSSIDPAGRERFVDASAPEHRRASSTQADALLDVGGVHDLAASRSRPTGRSPTRWRPSAGCSAPTSPRRARDAGGCCAVRPRRPGSPPRPALTLRRLRQRGRDHAVVPADHRRLAHADAAALARRAHPRHRQREHALRLRPRHADAQRVPQRRLHLPVATADPVRARPGGQGRRPARWWARSAGPTARPSSPTAGTRSTPTTST